ncbi:unnamed protein product [Brassica oleracea]|uniref:(rape) hypothetical protein n=1 Tax=Brassica napus TaxID=3708 RepID=A0A816K225_BRANA|nr:unnamed protein product [Brassica napus]
MTTLPYADVDCNLRALTGRAEGFGRFAAGGLHGDLCVVTSLSIDCVMMDLDLSSKEVGGKSRYGFSNPLCLGALSLSLSLHSSVKLLTFTVCVCAIMAMSELSTPKTTSPFLRSSSQLRLSSKLHLSNQFRHLLLPPPLHTTSISKSLALFSQNSQAPVAVQENGSMKTKKECYGVFCLTYDLKAVIFTFSLFQLGGDLIMEEDDQYRSLRCCRHDFKPPSLQSSVLGPNQPIALKLLGSERSIQALEGVAMELEDSLFPLLREVDIGTYPYEVFQDVDWALLIGAKPRGPGMERAALF